MHFTGSGPYKSGTEHTIGGDWVNRKFKPSHTSVREKLIPWYQVVNTHHVSGLVARSDDMQRKVSHELGQISASLFASGVVFCQVQGGQPLHQQPMQRFRQEQRKPQVSGEGQWSDSICSNLHHKIPVKRRGFVEALQA